MGAAIVKTVCPLCKSELVGQEPGLKCPNCSIIFPKRSGIIEFFRGTDEFYEGKFLAKPRRIPFLDNHKRQILKRASLFGIRTKHEKYYRHMTRLPGEILAILDLGCGTGNQDLKVERDYHVVGVDISLSSLIEAGRIYDEVYKASVTQLPLPQDIFHCVCSFDLIGHIPVKQKTTLIREIYRVLRPGGLSFNYIEVEPSKGYTSWAKQYPDLYKKHFVEKDGHFGLESYQTVLERFRNQGFSLLEYKVLAKMILRPGVYARRFNNEYKSKLFVINAIASLDAMLSKSAVTAGIVAIAMKPLEILFEPIVPDDYGGLLLTVHRKPVS